MWRESFRWFIVIYRDLSWFIVIWIDLSTIYPSKKWRKIGNFDKKMGDFMGSKIPCRISGAILWDPTHALDSVRERQGAAQITNSQLLWQSQRVFERIGISKIETGPVRTLQTCQKSTHRRSTRHLNERRETVQIHPDSKLSCGHKVVHCA